MNAGVCAAGLDIPDDVGMKPTHYTVHVGPGTRSPRRTRCSTSAITPPTGTPHEDDACELLATLLEDLSAPW